MPSKKASIAEEPPVSLNRLLVSYLLVLLIVAYLSINFPLSIVNAVPGSYASLLIHAKFGFI